MYMVRTNVLDMSGVLSFRFVRISLCQQFFTHAFEVADGNLVPQIMPSSVKQMFRLIPPSNIM